VFAQAVIVGGPDTPHRESGLKVIRGHVTKMAGITNPAVGGGGGHSAPARLCFGLDLAEQARSGFRHAYSIC
jgi:hypothetical protein